MPQNEPGAADKRLLKEFAPAKINLTLEICGRRDDGYHELISLVAFAEDVGDTLELAPGPRFDLTVVGPESRDLVGDNLIAVAAERLLRRHPSLMTGRFQLIKRLPIASGIGGGSTDAAAAMRALARANSFEITQDVLALAADIGADVPVCVGGLDTGPKAAMMGGIGERIWRPPERSLLPSGLYAVLVNPRVPVPTGSVFKALAAPPLGTGREFPRLEPFRTVEECLAFVRAGRNDLQEPAIGIAPAIGDVLMALGQAEACRVARMSGSGATCFGLFDNAHSARGAASRFEGERPDWWIATSQLK